MMGTVIRRASMTETTGGGGIRSAPAGVLQPDIVIEAHAIPRAIHPSVLDLFCPMRTMVVLLDGRVRKGNIIRRSALVSPRSNLIGYRELPCGGRIPVGRLRPLVPAGLRDGDIIRPPRT